jgi:hypothetical protein
MKPQRSQRKPKIRGSCQNKKKINRQDAPIGIGTGSVHEENHEATGR